MNSIRLSIHETDNSLTDSLRGYITKIKEDELDDTTENEDDSTQQQTKYKDETEIRKASFLFMMVGIGYLFPFSALTQPVDYWNLLFPNHNIEFPITSTFMYTNLAMLFIIVFFCEDPPSSGNSTSSAATFFTRRIVGGFLGQFLILLLIPTSYFWLAPYPQYNYLFILCATGIVAMFTAFLDSSVIALVSKYPLRVQESLQLGVGVSTLLGSIYRDTTKYLFSIQNSIQSSLLYFYSGAFTILFCILSYYLLLQMKLSKNVFFASSATTTPLDTTTVDETTGLLFQQPPPSNEHCMPPKNPHEDTTTTTKKMNRFQVLKQVWFHQCMVLLLFASTLALWPPLVTEIKMFSIDSDAAHYLQTSGWYSLLLLTLFSIFDCTGRIMSRYRFFITKDNLYLLVLLRIVILVPAILGCVDYPHGRIPWLSTLLPFLRVNHDGYSILFVSLLGFTNGYIGTLSIVTVIESVSKPEEESVAGMFTSFFLNTGLVIGASIGLLLQNKLNI